MQDTEPPPSLTDRLKPWWFVIVLAVMLISLAGIRVIATIHYSNTTSFLKENGYLDRPSVALSPNKPNAITTYRDAFDLYNLPGDPSDPFATVSLWGDGTLDDPFATTRFEPIGLLDWRIKLEWPESGNRQKRIQATRTILKDNYEAIQKLHEATLMPSDYCPAFDYTDYENLSEATRLLGHEFIINCIDGSNSQSREQSLISMLRADELLRNHGHHDPQTLAMIEIGFMHSRVDDEILQKLDSHLAAIAKDLPRTGGIGARINLDGFLGWFSDHPRDTYIYLLQSSDIIFSASYAIASISGVTHLDAAATLRFSAIEIDTWESKFSDWSGFYQSFEDIQVQRLKKPKVFIATRYSAAQFSPHAVIEYAVRVQALRCAIAILRGQPPLANNWDGKPATIGKFKQWTSITMPTHADPVTVLFLKPEASDLELPSDHPLNNDKFEIIQQPMGVATTNGINLNAVQRYLFGSDAERMAAHKALTKNGYGSGETDYVVAHNEQYAVNGQIYPNLKAAKEAIRKLKPTRILYTTTETMFPNEIPDNLKLPDIELWRLDSRK